MRTAARRAAMGGPEVRHPRTMRCGRCRCAAALYRPSLRVVAPVDVSPHDTKMPAVRVRPTLDAGFKRETRKLVASRGGAGETGSVAETASVGRELKTVVACESSDCLSYCKLMVAQQRQSGGLVSDKPGRSARTRLSRDDKMIFSAGSRGP